MSEVIYRQITAADEAAVIDLANEVHGDNYLSPESFQHYAGLPVRAGFFGVEKKVTTG